MRCTLFFRDRPKTSSAVLIIIAVLCLVAVGTGGNCFAAAQEQVLESTLPNGLKVILLENHKAPVVTFQVWYRVGSRNEAYSKTGLSHLLEHMMFKGTKKIGPGEFSRIVQQNGGDDNAFTSSDYTAYFQNLSADRIDVSLELESDRMHNLLLREEDFRTERSVVIEERRLRTEDSPKSVLSEQLTAIAFQTQPYRWPVIGWMQDLERLTLDDVKAHYKRYYSPSNAIIVVVGDFRKAELLPRIEKYFGSIPASPAPGQGVPLDDPQLGERRILVKREAQLFTIAMAYHVPNLRHPDSYVLEVIAALLSSGESSRLQTALVHNKQLVLGIDADNPLLSRDPGCFSIGADVLPGKNPAEVEKAIDLELERLQKEPVSDRELEKAKNQLEAAFIFGQDSFFYQAMLLARHEIAGEWRMIDEYLPAIRKVSADDIRRVAQHYLVPDNRTVATLVPLPSQKPGGPPSGKVLEEGAVR
jgi:zinc protease